MKKHTVNLNKQSVALHYDGKSAPTVTAKGRGYIADEILSLAKENDIPIKEDTDLVHFLSKIEMGTEIPENLYLAAAEVIAFAYHLKKKAPPER